MRLAVGILTILVTIGSNTAFACPGEEVIEYDDEKKRKCIAVLRRDDVTEFCMPKGMENEYFCFTDEGRLGYPGTTCDPSGCFETCM